jgi:CRISPR-associated protein Cas2
MENVDESLRGECTRFLLEVKAGIFLGTISAKVRELLWNTIKERIDEGGAILVFSYPNEQGFVLDMWGDPKRVVSDFEGLRLITNRA